jgi:hypothetical protein
MAAVDILKRCLATELTASYLELGEHNSRVMAAVDTVRKVLSLELLIKKLPSC